LYSLLAEARAASTRTTTARNAATRFGSCAMIRKNVRPPVVAARAARVMNSSGMFDRRSMAL